MTARVAINGFGRIGRLVLRAIAESGRRDVRVVAINDLGSAETNAHLLQYDSTHGPFPRRVRVRGDTLRAGSGPVRVLCERDPARLPWRKLDVDVALECTGLFTSRDKAARHLDAGAKTVLISAPAADADLTMVMGVNHAKLRKGHTVVSNASCTTNCLAPVAQVLHRLCGIRRGYATTIHAWTGDQPTVDSLHADLRRARAAGVSMIPTSTGAARALGLVLPDLAGKLDGAAIRVPTANVSIVDLVFTAGRKVTAAEINTAMKTAARTTLKGILDVTDAPLVSADFNHNPHSSILDAGQTQVTGGTLGRVLSWYDNEWGFANRMADAAAAMGGLVRKP